MVAPQVKNSYKFGPFLLDQHERQLFCNGELVGLAPKAFDVLLLLVENRGHLLQKDFLIEHLWPDAVVEENNLSQCIYVLRRALGTLADQNGTLYIETVPRHGYRFVAPVERISGEKGQSALSEPVVLPPIGAEGIQQHKRKTKWGLVTASAAGGLIVLAVVGIARWPAPPHAAAVRQMPQVLQSLAVLPFQSLNSPHTDEFLGLGLADALITRLSEGRQMNIRPLERVRDYSGGRVDPLRAGRELGVGAVLHGSIQRHAGRIRVTMQLLNVANGGPLWAGQVDTTFGDMFAVEDSVATEVARALVPNVISQARPSHAPTTNEQAFEDYMKGRFFWNKRTAQSLRAAVQFFQQAIAKDPGYAQAYAGMADAYNLLGFYGFLSPAESYPKAKRAALQALALDDGLAEAHASLLSIETDYDWDWAAAEKEFRRAVELNPSYASAYQLHAYVHLATGHIDRAKADLDRAMQLDPLSPGINTSIVWAYYLERRYDSSIKQCEKTLELYPDYVVAHQVLAMSYTQRGEYGEALVELRKVQELAPQNPMTELLLAHLYAVSGRHDEAAQVLEHVFVNRGNFRVPSYYVAAVYAALAQKDDAFRWLEQAYKERSNWLIYLKLDPRFDLLRTDPRLGSLLRQIGLS